MISDWHNKKMTRFTPLETMKQQAKSKMSLTGFTKRVYQIVSEIPIGQVRSYKWVAKKAGRAGASRAVGQILKNNPYPLIIPCHRVINADGRLGGYSRGRKEKERLLNLEKKIQKALRPKADKMF
ncbi:MAG: MGMT family protein [Candidatus Omnitrophota bacterium]